MTRSTVPIAEQTIESLLASIAERTPAPGGGAVAALTGALAVALAEMVRSYSSVKTTSCEDKEDVPSVDVALSTLRAGMPRLADNDATNFREFSALKKPKDTDPESMEIYEDAVRKIMEVPEQVLEIAESTLELCVELCEHSKGSIASDIAIAAILSQAAGRAAGWNIRVNLPLVTDRDARQQYFQQTHQCLLRLDRFCSHVEKSIRDSFPEPKDEQDRAQLRFFRNMEESKRLGL